jgi:8-oxo-dGTP pyrophosphatase MutT (NUDIX family)
MSLPLYVAAEANLQPVDAAAAILVDDAGRYLLQHRDRLPHIFYPDHWGCFGGAVEQGESPPQALARELSEELELESTPAEMRLFTRFDFDFSPLGKGKVYRIYYEMRLTARQARTLQLHEGQALGRFSARELFALARVTPYDAFALWMHYRSGRP